jgi:hypothetical protein
MACSMTHSTFMPSQIHTRFMKHAVAKIQSGIDTVGVQVESGFQVCLKNRLQNFVADQGFTSATEFDIRSRR